MPRDKIRSSGWQGAALVAIVYVDFLIFAQFAFLKRLAALGVADTRLKVVMGAMAAGGVLLSLLAPRIGRWSSSRLRLRVGLAASAAAAFFSLASLSFAAALAVSFLIGAGLGLLTVTLVTHLKEWTGRWNPFFAAGAGTGVGYLVCNIPLLFDASPAAQSLTGGAFCLAGILVTLFPERALAGQGRSHAESRYTLAHALPAFTALVWLDSAAFFIVQNTPALKSATWQGSTHLWSNGLLHLAAALLSAWLLRRRGLLPVLAAAFFALGAACLLLLDPSRSLLASILYPIGVSLYSVALVAYPSLLAAAKSHAERGRIAGWIYAVAGWAGSAMGIGMAQHLKHIPAAFVAAAGLVILIPQISSLLRRRAREVALTALVALAAFFLNRISAASHPPQPLAQVERGRQVYISEGCINCHSQYIRPHTADVPMWGPAATIEAVRREQPPLIGNRRQGPDLSEVGARRSALWLKAHFFDPPEMNAGSIMPSYGFLFRDHRGDDLVAYLRSLGAADVMKRADAEEFWQPEKSAIAHADAREGERLFQGHCTTCHDARGRTRLTWQSDFKRLPTDLAHGPYVYLLLPQPQDQLVVTVARVAKFGIPGTDMPGHEYLTDRQVASIALWLSQIIKQPGSKTGLQL